MKIIKTIVVLFILFTTVLCTIADALELKPMALTIDTTLDTINLVKNQSNSVINEIKPIESKIPMNITMILALLLSLYEVVVRFLPTVKDISILSWLMKFIGMILPNLKKGGGKHPL